LYYLVYDDWFKKNVMSTVFVNASAK